MATRYFQHLDPTDPDFPNVTELEYIDDTDPNFVLYYFKDGSKCNQDFIAKLNDRNAFKKFVFTEVSNKNNIWRFDIKENSRTNAEPQYVTAADGTRYEIPSAMDYTNSQAKEGLSISVKSKPEFAVVKTEKVESKKVENIKEKVFDFNKSTMTTDNLIKALMKSDIIEFDYNNKHYSMSPTEFLNNATTKEKIVTKEVVKEVVKEIPADHIDLGLEPSQKALIDNMIDMSAKETCDIEMEVTLSLPPISVYQLIKQVYPKGMAKGFVNIIADRMQIKELKMAVANGLLGYYDEDAEIEVNSNEEETNNDIAEIVETDSSLKEEIKPIKKAGRPRKANK